MIPIVTIVVNWHYFAPFSIVNRRRWFKTAATNSKLHDPPFAGKSSTYDV